MPLPEYTSKKDKETLINELKNIFHNNEIITSVGEDNLPEAMKELDRYLKDKWKEEWNGTQEQAKLANLSGLLGYVQKLISLEAALSKGNYADAGLMFDLLSRTNRSSSFKTRLNEFYHHFGYGEYGKAEIKLMFAMAQAFEYMEIYMDSVNNREREKECADQYTNLNNRLNALHKDMEEYVNSCNDNGFNIYNPDSTDSLIEKEKKEKLNKIKDINNIKKYKKEYSTRIKAIKEKLQPFEEAIKEKEEKLSELVKQENLFNAEKERLQQLENETEELRKAVSENETSIKAVDDAIITQQLRLSELEKLRLVKAELLSDEKSALAVELYSRYSMRHKKLSNAYNTMKKLAEGGTDLFSLMKKCDNGKSFSKLTPKEAGLINSYLYAREDFINYFDEKAGSKNIKALFGSIEKNPELPLPQSVLIYMGREYDTRMLELSDSMQSIKDKTGDLVDRYNELLEKELDDIDCQNILKELQEEKRALELDKKRLQVKLNGKTEKKDQFFAKLFQKLGIKYNEPLKADSINNAELAFKNKKEKLQEALEIAREESGYKQLLKEAEAVKKDFDSHTPEAIKAETGRLQTEINGLNEKLKSSAALKKLKGRMLDKRKEINDGFVRLQENFGDLKEYNKFQLIQAKLSDIAASIFLYDKNKDPQKREMSSSFKKMYDSLMTAVHGLTDSKLGLQEKKNLITDLHGKSKSYLNAKYWQPIPNFLASRQRLTRIAGAREIFDFTNTASLMLDKITEKDRLLTEFQSKSFKSGREKDLFDKEIKDIRERLPKTNVITLDFVDEPSPVLNQ